MKSATLSFRLSQEYTDWPSRSPMALAEAALESEAALPLDSDPFILRGFRPKDRTRCTPDSGRPLLLPVAFGGGGGAASPVSCSLTLASSAIGVPSAT
eukprot:scaffold162047_cov29-Tisochrysis_lutea.AAC.2